MKMTTASKSKMRICIISEGKNVHTHRHVDYFVDRGHEVHLIDINPYRYKNLKMHLVKNITGIKFIDYFLRIVQAIIAVKKIKPDVLHSLQVTYHGFVGALSGTHPFVLTPWGSDILFVPDESLYYKLITKFTIFKTDAIHCIDVSVLNRLMQMYGDEINKKKFFILNEGVDISFFMPMKKIQKQNVSILCLRVLRESYGPLFLIEALNILVNKKNKKNLKVIMLKTALRTEDEPYQTKVHDAVKKYNLVKYVEFHDWKNHQTRSLMKKADIYVDTIYRPVQGQGTGKTMLEALSSGLAVIAPDNPSIELYIKNEINGLIYRGANPESLANAILKLAENRNLRVKLGKNARKFAVKNLDIKKNMKIMELRYFKLIGKKNI